MLTEILKNAGSMTPVAVAFWLIFNQFMHQVKEDREELKKLREEWIARLDDIIEVVRTNAIALEGLRDELRSMNGKR